MKPVARNGSSATLVPTALAVGTSGLVLSLRTERLLTACAIRGLSLASLARESGVSEPTLRSAVRGNSIRPTTAYKIATVLERIEPRLSLEAMVANE
jgi:lambda repressor-like predicted transcriptional regulator